MHAWLLTTPRSVAAGSGIARAIEHAFKCWPALQRPVSSDNVADVTHAHALLHGDESAALADAGYQGVEKRPEALYDHESSSPC